MKNYKYSNALLEEIAEKIQEADGSPSKDGTVIYLRQAMNLIVDAIVEITEETI